MIYRDTKKITIELNPEGEIKQVTTESGGPEMGSPNFFFDAFNSEVRIKKALSQLLDRRVNNDSFKSVFSD